MPTTTWRRWNGSTGNSTSFGAHTETHLEGKPGQLNVWSTSPDFETWSVPQPLAHVGHSPLPRDPVCVQWQPNLLNYRDQQLWCVWSFNSKNPATSMASIDPVDFAAGQSLEFRFETKVLRLQEIGMLILCSLGDRIPIRLGMPANRPGKLYAYTRNQWEPVGDFPMQQWHSLRVTVRGATSLSP